MEKELSLEERYQIYIERHVGLDEPKNDGSGETISGKRTMENFLWRKRANAFTTQEGVCYASKWLDEERIPRYK